MIRVPVEAHCSACPRYTTATAERISVGPAFAIHVYGLEFPKDAFDVSSKWVFDEGQQVALCPEHAPKETT